MVLVVEETVTCVLAPVTCFFCFYLSFWDTMGRVASPFSAYLPSYSAPKSFGCGRSFIRRYRWAGMVADGEPWLILAISTGSYSATIVSLLIKKY